jgi:hypothetical protein
LASSHEGGCTHPTVMSETNRPTHFFILGLMFVFFNSSIGGAFASKLISHQGISSEIWSLQRAVFLQVSTSGLKSGFIQIQFIHKSIHHPHRIILADQILQTVKFKLISAIPYFLCMRKYFAIWHSKSRGLVYFYRINSERWSGEFFHRLTLCAILERHPK